MTLSDIATAQLWETFRAGGGAELVRDAERLVLQELIEAEATEVIGAARYERSDARVTERNGHRPRLLATQAADMISLTCDPASALSTNVCGGRVHHLEGCG